MKMAAPAEARVDRPPRLRLLSFAVLLVAGACGRPSEMDFLQARADALATSHPPGGVILICGPEGAPGQLLATIAIQRSWAQALKVPRTCDAALNLDELPVLLHAKEFLGDIGRQGRKKRLAISVGYQYPASLSPPVRDLMEGSIRNKIYFAQDREADARAAAKLFRPRDGQPGMTEQDFLALGKHRAAVRMGGPPYFTVDTLPLPTGSNERREQCIAAARARWARPKADVDAEIVRRMRDPLVVLGRKGRPRVRVL